jgi:hypothetical protein
MGLLNWYFPDDRKIKHALYADDEITSIWGDYVASFEKKKIVNKLLISDLSNLKELIRLLEHEIMDIEKSQSEEEQVLEDLKAVSKLYFPTPISLGASNERNLLGFSPELNLVH